MLPYTFYTDVNKPKQFVIYGDTDSLYINVPDLKPASPQEAVQMATEISEAINGGIRNFMNNEMLPKMGIDPQYNKTSFKTELVADSILLLSAKKSYAYRMLAKENKIIDPPEMSYTGISVKSDISGWTRDFLRGIIEKYALNPEIDPNDAYNLMNEFAKEMHDKLSDAVNNYDFHYIGVPKKWGTKYKEKDPFQLTAMKLYNTIINERELTPMSGSLVLPIQIRNPNEFNTKIAQFRNAHPLYIDNIPSTNLNYLAFPYGYDKEKVKKAMEYYTIYIDVNDVWDKIFNKQAKEITELQVQVVRNRKVNQLMK